jgi:hypothetical protein
MTLKTQTTYPSTRRYVLKLHRDASPRREQIAGQIENIASGRHFEFNGTEELFEYLAADMSSTHLPEQE